MIHLPIRISSAPNQPDEYRALCGYTSTDKREFRLDPHKPLSVVGCGSCLEHLGRVVVREEWTIKQGDVYADAK